MAGRASKHRAIVTATLFACNPQMHKRFLWSRLDAAWILSGSGDLTGAETEPDQSPNYCRSSYDRHCCTAFHKTGFSAGDDPGVNLRFAAAGWPRILRPRGLPELTDNEQRNRAKCRNHDKADEVYTEQTDVQKRDPGFETSIGKDMHRREQKTVSVHSFRPGFPTIIEAYTACQQVKFGPVSDARRTDAGKTRLSCRHPIPRTPPRRHRRVPR